MKTILCLLSIAGLLCGCGKRVAVQSPPVKDEPAAQVAPAPKTFAPVVGGMGWMLGETLPAGLDADPWSYHFDTNGIFGNVVLELNNRVQICSIKASTPLDQRLPDDQLEALKQDLTEKYGLVGASDTEDGPGWVFGGPTNFVSVMQCSRITILYYSSDSLRDERQAQMDDAQKKALPNL